MEFTNSDCFVCLKSSDILIEVTDITTHSIFQQVRFVIPELDELQLEVALGICTSCQIILTSFFKFKKSCIENLETLKSYLAESEIKNEKNTDENNEDQTDSKNNIEDESQELDTQNTSDSDDSKCDETKGVKNKKRYRNSCPLCNKRFKTKWHLRRHAQSHARTKEYNCAICNRTFSREQHLADHLVVHGIKAYECIECKKTFTTKFLHDRHFKVHHDKTDYRCNICNKTFPIKSYLNAHLKRHAEANRRKRSIKVTQAGFINEKRNIESTELIRNCIYIKEEANFEDESLEDVAQDNLSKSELNTEYNEFKEETAENEYKCSICNKEFDTPGCLSRHTKAHARNKEYTCSICSRKFTRKQFLENHLNVHGIKPYECIDCKKKFSRKFLYDRHLKVHHNKNEYKCPICDKKFLLKAYLNTHIKRHTDNDGVECSLCKKIFVSDYNLKRHVDNYHYQIRNYGCSKCNKRFMFKGQLVKHLKTAKHKPKDDDVSL